MCVPRELDDYERKLQAMEDTRRRDREEREKTAQKELDDYEKKLQAMEEAARRGKEGGNNC